MKILALIILTATCYPALSQEADAGQTQPLSRKELRAERHALGHKENNIFVTIASGYNSLDQVMVTFKIEYSRQIKRNFYWGGALSVNHGFKKTSDPSQNIYKLDAMVYYRAPVIYSRLFFRIGTGIGVGYHDIYSKQRNNQSLDDKVLPYFNFEAAWILRCSRSFEMKFSPIILFMPSQIAISPVKFGRPTNITPIICDFGASLTFGWRF